MNTPSAQPQTPPGAGQGPADSHSAAAPARAIDVLLVDDQPMVEKVLRGMLADDHDIRLHYCQDPTEAIDQANALAPSVILQDLVMPDIDGLSLVKFYRANPATRDTPLIVLSSQEEPTVKAEAFVLGANDYLVKLPDQIEMVARIRYHAKGYIALMERNQAYRQLAESQQQLTSEVAEAAKYVRSLLPAPITEGCIRIDWRFVPSTQLGGDSFGYHWLDKDHFAVYLLDVCGHGVGSSLLSVSALDVLRTRSLRDTDFRSPGQVLEGLNKTFDTDLHDEKFFTIWYGVFNRKTKELRYAGAGHPPVLLFSNGSRGYEPVRLESTAPFIGVGPNVTFPEASITLGTAAKLFLFSDGVYEIQQKTGGMWEFEDLAHFLRDAPADGPVMDALLKHVQGLHGAEQLADDFSIMEIDWLGRRSGDYLTPE